MRILKLIFLIAVVMAGRQLYLWWSYEEPVVHPVNTNISRIIVGDGLGGETTSWRKN